MQETKTRFHYLEILQIFQPSESYLKLSNFELLKLIFEYSQQIQDYLFQIITQIFGNQPKSSIIGHFSFILTSFKSIQLNPINDAIPKFLQKYFQKISGYPFIISHLQLQNDFFSLYLIFSKLFSLIKSNEEKNELSILELGKLSDQYIEDINSFLTPILDFIQENSKNQNWPNSLKLISDEFTYINQEFSKIPQCNQYSLHQIIKDLLKTRSMFQKISSTKTNQLN
jgi:hypothetical protein